MKKINTKKILSLLIVPLFIMAGLTGCGDKKSSVGDHKESTPTSASNKNSIKNETSNEKTKSGKSTKEINKSDKSEVENASTATNVSVAAQSNSTTESQYNEGNNDQNADQSQGSNQVVNQNTAQSSNKNAKTINIESYSSYDNKLKAFYFKRNGANQPTDTEADFKTMFKKYNTYFQGDTSKKEIYLTFDEGYENGFTGKILDTLKQNNVKAAFFVTGDYIKRESDLVKRMVAEGHIVGNHTVHHFSMPTVSTEVNRKDISGLTDMFTNLTSSDMIYFRAPKGEFSERTLKLTSDMGYKTIFWSYAYDDWDTKKTYSVDYIYDKFMKNLHNGEVVLLHAVSKGNADALDKIIKAVKAKGYEFKTLDDLK